MVYNNIARRVTFGYSRTLIYHGTSSEALRISPWVCSMLRLEAQSIHQPEPVRSKAMQDQDTVEFFDAFVLFDRAARRKLGDRFVGVKKGYALDSRRSKNS